MSPSIYFTTKIVCLLLFMSVLVSCEDKAIVQKNEALLEQVAESEAKVEVLENEVGENPGDQTEKLEQTRKLLNEANAQLEQLHAAEAKVIEEHQRAKQDYQQYRVKYPIK